MKLALPVLLLLVVAACHEAGPTAPLQPEVRPAATGQMPPSDLRIEIIEGTDRTERGVVLTGLVSAGRVAVGDTICLRTRGNQLRELAVLALRVRGMGASAAQAGDLAGLLVAAMELEEITAGDELVTCAVTLSREPSARQPESQ